MNNTSQKQFPNLMAGKSIMYVHGFASSAQSGTVKRLRTMLPETTIIAEDLPIHPQEALDMLRQLCESRHPDLVIGTSMGGMFTEQLYGYDRIVVNPALRIADTMVSHGLVGAQHFMNPRKDGVQDFMVTKALVREYAEVQSHCMEGVNDSERQRVVGLFGDQDDLVDTYDLFHAHYPTAIHFHGGHRMDDHSFSHAVVPVIRWFDDRQEQRQRPVVFIDTDALIDPWQKPLSSAQKAYRQLIEQYDVHIVTPAPRYKEEQVATVVAWTEEYLGVPAFNHLTMSNHREQLLGDFLITRRPCDAFMGTVIELGSTTFKTWEEVITYFERITM